MNNKLIRPIALSVVSFLLIIVFVYYLYKNADQYRALLQISPIQVISLFFLSIVFPLIAGIQNTFLYRSMGAEVSWLDGCLVAAASTLANQLPISGGIISKGYYLKRRHDVSYAKFFSGIVALYFCFLAASGLIGVIILFYWAFFKLITVSPVLWIGFFLMVACFLVFWIPIERMRVPKHTREWIRQAVEGWLLISRNPFLLLRLVGLQGFLMILLAIRYWISFHMLSQSVTITQAVLFSSASLLTQLVSIAPGGLGVRELIVGAVASTLGFDVGVSVVAVGLDRLVSTLAVLLMGGISMVILGKQILDPSVRIEEQ